ncbi:MAG: tRNA (adenosine(37)-N6)-threonylcarbamoyltransferase complex dimerization subunit type 1 TsaB [Rhizobiaceae bacterium]
MLEFLRAPLLLAIDTAANLCAACVWDTEAHTERGRAVEAMTTGHAERLMAVIQEALDAAGVGYKDLGAVALSVGPGSFTGVRVGVSTARGLALALKIPAIGVTTLEAVAAETLALHPGSDTLVAIDAGRGNAYVGVYDAFAMLRYGPVMLSLDETVELAREGDPVLSGTAAASVAERTGIRRRLGPAIATADVATYARLAAAKPATADKPVPLYLRPPDAKPQASHVLPRRPG